ncbi:MAG: class I SAM-dependent methyltransferase [Acidimicrobiales bacterium]
MAADDDLLGTYRGLFDGVAAAYVDGRPGYPDELWRRLAELDALTAGCRLLEIGPGGGQATGPMLDAGASIVAVELGDDFADVLRRRHAGRPLEVLVGPFESVDLPGEPFDLVAAATSFHWVPTEVGLARAAGALRPDGVLALWWNVFGDPDRPDPFHEAFAPLATRLAPSPPEAGAHPYALRTEERIAEISAAGFDDIEVTRLSWTGRHSPAGLRAMFATFSPILALEEPDRTEVLDGIERLAAEEFGGVVERPYLTMLYTAVRR